MSQTIASLLLARRDDDHLAVVDRNRQLTWAEHVAASARCANWLLATRSVGSTAPFHVGLLMGNAVAHSVWLGGTALAGAVAVGLNATRSVAELVRDARHADVERIIAGPAHAELAEALASEGFTVHRIDAPDFSESVHAMASTPPDVVVEPDDLFMLIFTSGTTSAPKAVRCSHGRICGSGAMLPLMLELTAADTAYVSMPLFHSNAIIAGWTPMLAVGGTIALPGRFSASGFLDDVRTFGATYANYVGKALAHILATPARSDDGDNPLRVVFGNEASDRDIARFSHRFDCRVVDGYGSTEGGIACLRTPETPRGSLGIGMGDIHVLDPETGRDCAVAQIDAAGRLRNATAAIGELVRVDSDGGFEGYWRNEEADRERVRGGHFHSGDLAYRDAAGFLYFAGRISEWLRVDGENLAAAPIERVLADHHDVITAAVVAVPDMDAGDQLLAALQVADPQAFDVRAFDAWLQVRGDLSAKARPRFVRLATSLPQTATNKVDRRALGVQGWNTSDLIWWRPGRDDAWRALDNADRTDLDKRVADRLGRDVEDHDGGSPA